MTSVEEDDLFKLKQDSAHLYQLDLDRAMAVAEQAYQYATQIGTPDARGIGAWIKANAHTVRDEWQKATALFEESDRFLQLANQTLYAARMSVGFVAALAHLGRIKQAIEVAERVERQLVSRPEDLSDAVRLASLWLNMGSAYDLAGDPEAALKYFEKSREQYAKVDDMPGIFQSDQNMALALLTLNLLDEAELVFNRVREGFLSEDPPNFVDLNRVMMNLATLHAHRGNHIAALTAFHEAGQYLDKQTGVDVQQLLTQMHCAFVQIASADRILVEQGCSILRARLAEVDQIGPSFERGLAYINLAHGHLILGDTQAASEYSLTAMQLAKLPTGEPFAWRAYLVAGQTAWQLGEHSAAIAHFKTAIDCGEQLTSQVAIEWVRASALGDKLQANWALARAYLELGDIEKSLEVVQYLKSRELRQSAERSNQEIEQQRLQTIDPVVASEIAELRQEIGLYLRQARLALLSGETERAEEHLAHHISLEEKLRQKNRDAQRLVWSKYQPSATESRPQSAIEHLLPTEIGIEYVSVSDRMWAFVVKRGCIPLHIDLGPTAAIVKLAREYRQSIERALSVYASPNRERFAARLQRDVDSIGHKLYDLLVRPIRERDEWPKANTIVIGIDPVISELPIHALPDESQQTLLDSWQVRYLPSLSLLVPVGMRPQARCVAISGASEHMLWSKRELQAVQDCFPSAQLFDSLGVDADKTREILGDCDILHLSTHAAYNLHDPTLTALAMGARDITVDELSGFRFKDACVVLSACEALKGRLAGANVFSLARAFMVGGATTVVASLWRIAEDAGAELLIDFYGYLAQGQSVTNALCEAQRQWKIKHQGLLRHPAFWAAMTVVGRDVIYR